MKLHISTATEREFLRAATRDYPELRQQIEQCEISDVDVEGTCWVTTRVGSPLAEFLVGNAPAAGPEIASMDAPGCVSAGILLWTDSAGMLERIEMYAAGEARWPAVLEAFVAATRAGRLVYPTARSDDGM